MLARLSLLVFLPIFSATATHNGLEPAELVDTFSLLPKCKSTAWRDTYDEANYVAVVDVTNTVLQSDGSFIVSYKEVLRYKGDAPLQLRTVNDPILLGRRYLVAAQKDGRLYYCNGFSTVNGGIPSGAPQHVNVSPFLYGRLYEWSVGSRLMQALPQKKPSGGLSSNF